MSSIHELFTELITYQEQKKTIELVINELKAKLASKIPENSAKMGVSHTISLSKSVSYAKALPEISDLVPKSKKPLIQDILDSHTKDTPHHLFKSII